MKRILTALLVVSSAVASAQQMPHFSLWQDQMALINPAAQSVLPDDFSFFANYRGQYLNASPIPNRTNSFMFESKVYDDKINYGWIGAGLQLYNDETGVTKIGTNAAYVPINYVQELQENTFLSVALKPGYINRSLSAPVQTWDNQWNGTAFDQTILSGELSAKKINLFDMGAGIYFQKEWPSKTRLNLGLAVNHLNRPDVTFRQLTNELSRQYLGHFRYEIKPRNVRFKISPQYIYFNQHPLVFHQYGVSIDFLLREGSQRTLFVQDRTIKFGVGYRNTGALITTVVLQFEGFGIGLAFDTDLSTSQPATGYVGGTEAFLRYSILKERRKRFIR